MKFYLLILFFPLLLFSQGPLKEIKDFGDNPGKLSFFMHAPKTRKDKMPLVVALHGCNMSAEMLSRLSGWDKLADTIGFYVIYPQQRFLNNTSNCFNWFNEKDICKDRGEAASIKRMIDFMIDSFRVDSSKIFVYGLSAGAAMAAAMLADYPDLFNAGAILAGGPFITGLNPITGFSAMVSPKKKSSRELGELVKTQNPGYKKNYPRVILLHGKNDKVVNIKNSYELVKQWAYLLGTDTMPSKKTASFANHKDIEKKFYCNKQHEEKIIFYEVDKLGHTLMVDPGVGLDHGGEKGLFAVDKDFFSTYYIARDFGLIK